MIADHTTPAKLFTLAATLSRHEANGSLSIQLAHGFRVAVDGEDAVVGRWVRHIMAQRPGFSLSGNVSVIEITQDDLKTMEPAYAG